MYKLRSVSEDFVRDEKRHRFVSVTLWLAFAFLLTLAVSDFLT